MPRKPRDREDRAFHHVYARGNRRGAVFHDDEDRRWFLTRLMRVERDSRAVHVAHCLMTNHVHLLVQPGESGISRLLQRVLGAYSQWFNRRHGCTGHVFQGRFGSRVIDSDEDLLLILRYVHRNPVEAGMVTRPEVWKWSSHADHLLVDPPEYIRDGARFARSRLSEDPHRALVMYRRLIENPDGELLLPVPNEASEPVPKGPRSSMPARPELEVIAHRLEDLYSLQRGSVRGPGRTRKQTTARRAFCREAVKVHRYSLTETAAFLGRSLSNTSVMLRNAESRDLRLEYEYEGV